MSRIESRIKRMEHAVGAIKQPPLILWMEPGESDEECLKRHGADSDPKSVTFVSWAEGSAD